MGSWAGPPWGLFMRSSPEGLACWETGVDIIARELTIESKTRYRELAVSGLRRQANGGKRHGNATRETRIVQKICSPSRLASWRPSQIETTVRWLRR